MCAHPELCERRALGGRCLGHTRNKAVVGASLHAPLVVLHRGLNFDRGGRHLDAHRDD